MSEDTRLVNNLRRVLGAARLAIYQGIVTGVDGDTCTCDFGDFWISGIRLRASLSEVERHLVIYPRVGSAVILGSLSGDLSDLAVLQVDEADRIEINGAKLGGLINIETLTAKLNELVDAFNSHTHTIAPGIVAVTGSVSGMANPKPVSVPAVTKKAARLKRSDYEDETVKH